MAIFDSLNLSFLGSNYLAIGGTVIIGIIIFVVIEFSVRRSRAESGTYSERAMENEEGLGVFGRAIRSIQAYRIRAKGLEKFYKSKEASQESKERESSAIEADQAVVEGAQAAEHEEAAEVAAEGVEGRSIGILAAIKKITRAMVEYANKKKSNELSEEQEAAFVDGILKKINNTANYNVIDERISAYLNRFLRELASDLQNQVRTEEEKNELMGSLAKKIKYSVDEMKKYTSQARTGLGKLRKEEAKTRSKFRKELKYFEDSLNAKVKELRSLNSIKDVDKRVASSRISEMGLLSRQMESSKAIKSQLEATYSFIKSEIRQMKKLLKYVKGNENDAKRYDGVIRYRKKQINDRFKSLKSALSSIEKIAEAKTENPHQIAAYLSSGLKNYFETYSGILEEDLSFDSTVKDIIVKSFVMSQQMEVFDKLYKSFTKSKEALKSGVKALTEMTKSIVGEESKRNVDEIIQTLEGARKIIDDEQSIESYMENLAQALQNKSRQLNSEVQLIIEEDQKLIAQIKADEERNSSRLFSFIGTAVKRKVEIDGKYMAQARAFGNDLQKRNKNAAGYYRQAMNAESLAAAA